LFSKNPELEDVKELYEADDINEIRKYKSLTNRELQDTMEVSYFD